MNLQERNEAILALLKRDARIPVQEIADRLMLQPQEVSQAIEEMERQGTILGYTTLLGNEEERQTRAIIEVQIQPERDSGFDAIAQRICKF